MTTNYGQNKLIDEDNNKLMMENMDGGMAAQKTPVYSKDKWSTDLIQLSFDNIVIETVPQVSKCCGMCAVKNPLPSKTILNGVSGTIMPG